MIIEFLIGCVIFLLLVLATKKPDGLPPGEWGWPIIGFLPSQTEPLSFYIDKFIQKYGKTFTWRMGGRTFVFLCDYNVLKSAFNNPLLNYRPRMFSHDAFSNFQRLGMVNKNGLPWSNIRRFTLSHLRDKGMGKSSLEDVINFEVEAMVKDFQKQTDKDTEIPLSLNVAIINVLWQMLASTRYEVTDKKIQDFQKLVDDTFNDFQSTSFMIYDLFPWINKMIPHSFKGHIGLGASFRRIARYGEFLKEAINEHKATLDEYNPRDFIDNYLIELMNHKAGKGSENTQTFKEDDLLYILSDIYGAGSGSTSGAIKWMIMYMVKYPEIQKKVQNQIDEVVPRDRFPSLEDRQKLPYVDAAFFEVMRIRTPSPVGVHHCAQEDTTIENFRIPKGTMVVSAIEACHFDADYWKDPQAFKPERFIRPDGSLDNKKDGLLPFSIGRRACPGEALARMEVFLFISALLQKFTFSSPEGLDVDLTPDPRSPIFVLPNPCKISIKGRL